MQFHSLLFLKILVNGFEFVTPNKVNADSRQTRSNGKLQNEKILTIFFILLTSGAIDVDDFTCPSLVFSGTRKQHQRGPVSRNWVRANPTNVMKAFCGSKR